MTSSTTAAAASAMTTSEWPQQQPATTAVCTGLVDDTVIDRRRLEGSDSWQILDEAAGPVTDLRLSYEFGPDHMPWVFARTRDGTKLLYFRGVYPLPGPPPAPDWQHYWQQGVQATPFRID